MGNTSDSLFEPDGLALQPTLSAETRLAVVRSSGLLDTPPEETFDALTRLAVRLIAVPASFISIVDEKRDFYKSQCGFAEPLANTREISGTTFCHYALSADGPLVINDTHAKPRWKAVPTVTSLGVRAYVGIPLQVDGQRIGSFCVIDVEPRAWSADEIETLVQLAASVQRELNLRSAFARTAAEAERARALARGREEIMAVIAHDVRTPLQVLHLSALSLQHGGALDGAVIARMQNAVAAIRSMIEKLLSRATLLEAAPLSFEPINAAALLADAADMMRPIAERSAITLASAAIEDGRLAIDYAQALRLLSNLVGNAIKYSPAGATVRLGTRRAGTELIIEVADEGCGMTHEEQQRAFERGWQGAQSLARGDGAGLGLAIVKSIAEQHGGRVSLESEPKVGSRFMVTLPLVEPI